MNRIIYIPTIALALSTLGCERHPEIPTTERVDELCDDISAASAIWQTGYDRDEINAAIDELIDLVEYATNRLHQVQVELYQLDRL